MATTLPPLLPLLRELYLLPDLPSSLQGLTFPELFFHKSSLTSSERKLSSAQLLDLERVAPLLREIYEDNSTPSRLFALLDREELILFSAQGGEELFQLGRCSATAIGDHSLFISCDQRLLESLFPTPLWEGLIALAQSTPLSIAESSPIGAVRFWILNQERQKPLLDSLFDHLPDLPNSKELLHLIAEEGKAEAIHSAIDHGARPNEVDRNHQTPLHRAVQSGRVENAIALIASGADKDPQDLDGKSPLHLALIQGNRSMVEPLLEMGCDPRLLTFSRQNLLHLAVLQGSIDLVGSLLRHSASRDWLNQVDSDGKSALHLAVCDDPKPAIVQLLISAGACVDLSSPGGFTALHWAAMHGHFESSRLLLQAGARIDLSNENGDIPFDLALTSGHDELVGLFLGVGESSSSSGLSSSSSTEPLPTSSDAEGATYLAFEKAYESENKRGQAFWLQKLAQIRIEKRDHLSAAHLLNASFVLALASGVTPSYKAHLLNQLERIEERFLWETLQKKSPEDHRGYLAHYRNRLETVRSQFAERLINRTVIEANQELLTQGYQEILISLIEESIRLIGQNPPDRFAVMGLGSMARREVAPYSDIEFAFLIQDNSPETVSYFRELSQLLTLKMVNMGETKCELLRFKRGKGGREDRPAKSFVPTGFSMDIGGLCPAGKSGVYELIGTPNQLAQLQREKWLRSNSSEIILVNAMTTVSCLMGDPRLVDAYKKDVKKILDKKVGRTFWQGKIRPLRQVRALELIRGFVSEFEPRLNQDKIDLRGFDVKKELYRLPQTVISGLALYYGLKSSNTLEKIDELQGKGLISPAGADRLKQVFRSILTLRAQAHLFYKTECEILYHDRGEGAPEDERLFMISPEMKSELIEIYRTLVPLYRQASDFLRGDKRSLRNASFYDPSVGAYDDRLRQNLQYAPALTSAEGHAALDPTSDTQWTLGRAQTDIGKNRESAKSFEETLRLLKKEHGDQPHPEIAAILKNLGNVYRILGENARAIDCLKQSLKMNMALYGDQPRPEIAANLNNLGAVYQGLGKNLKAIDYCNQSLKMGKLLYGDQPNEEIASTLNNLGSAYRALGENSQAIDFFKKSLTMQLQLYGDQPYPEIAMSLMNLGIGYHSLGDYTQAISCLEESLAMKKELYGDHPHPEIANSLNNLGTTYLALGKNDQAIHCLEQSLAMKKVLCEGSPHPSLVDSLLNLGNIYRALADYTRAISYYEESLKICNLIYVEKPHPNTSNSLNNLGLVYRALGKYVEAIECHQQSLAMKRQLYGDQPHPDITASLVNLGMIYFTLGQNSQAIEYYMQSLAMMKQLYHSRPHPDMIKALNNLGGAYYALGKITQAAGYYKQSLKMGELFYGDRPHSDTAMSLMNLGTIYHTLGDNSRAIKYYKLSLTMKRKLYGDEAHPEVANSLNNLGALYLALGKSRKSIDYFEQSLAMSQQLYGAQPHFDTASTLGNLGAIYLALGNRSKAAELLQNSYDLFIKTVGKDHSSAKWVKGRLKAAKARPH